MPEALDNIVRLGDSEQETEALKDSTLAFVFDWEFLVAWIGCSTWAEISDSLENQENGDIDDETKLELNLMRCAFLLCITALYNNPYSARVPVTTHTFLISTHLAHNLLRPTYPKSHPISSG